MDEYWSVIPNFSNYMVSSNGRIFSKKRQILLIPYIRSGYEIVYLYKEGKRYKKSVHRIVAETFINNVSNKPCVDHINTIRNDNRIENLRWVTHSENVRGNPLTYSKYIRKKGCESHLYGKRYSAKNIYAYDDYGCLVKSYDAICDVSKDGFNPSSASRSAKCSNKKYKDLTWSFVKLAITNQIINDSSRQNQTVGER